MKLRELLEPTPPHAPPKLSPPPEPTIIEESIDLELEDWYDDLVRRAMFKRFIFYVRTGKEFRGSNVALDKELKKQVKVIDSVKANFGNVINEFKTKVKKIKSK